MIARRLRNPSYSPGSDNNYFFRRVSKASDQTYDYKFSDPGNLSRIYVHIFLSKEDYLSDDDYRSFFRTIE